MNQITTAHYKRITKTAARRVYAAGGALYFCPVNLNPESPWGLLYGPVNTAEPFDTHVELFEQYNCPCIETGRYAAFYIPHVQGVK